ncbi:MAG: hypothetical protein P8141_01585 [Gammaproteobacteria bacterium]
MPMKIEQKIVKYSVMKEGDKTGASDAQAEDSEDTSNHPDHLRRIPQRR